MARIKLRNCQPQFKGKYSLAWFKTFVISSEAMMYNPINNSIEDEERLKEKDLREKNKKIRYQARGIQEAKTKQEMENKMKKDADMSMRKVSHMRVREEIERGFDILSNGTL